MTFQKNRKMSRILIVLFTHHVYSSFQISMNVPITHATETPAVITSRDHSNVSVTVVLLEMVSPVQVGW